MEKAKKKKSVTRPKLPERNRTSDCANCSMPVIRICHNNIHKFRNIFKFYSYMNVLSFSPPSNEIMLYERDILAR